MTWLHIHTPYQVHVFMERSKREDNRPFHAQSPSSCTHPADQELLTGQAHIKLAVPSPYKIHTGPLRPWQDQPRQSIRSIFSGHATKPRLWDGGTKRSSKSKKDAVSGAVGATNTIVNLTSSHLSSGLVSEARKAPPRQRSLQVDLSITS